MEIAITMMPGVVMEGKTDSSGLAMLHSSPVHPGGQVHFTIPISIRHDALL